MSRNGLRFIILFGGLVALVFFLNALFPGALDDPDQRMRLVYSLTLLVFLSAGLIAGSRYAPTPVLRYALIWIALGAVLVVLFSYREEFDQVTSRVRGDLAPSHPVREERGVETVTAGPRGHFFVVARINNQPVKMLIDTGATEISLAPRDARRIGFDPDALTYSLWVQTANGRARGAPIELDAVEVGSIALSDVDAHVMGQDTEISLLGMSFLSQLSGYEVSNNRFTMRQ
ncbi:MAG: TIGR02281 family clan AA aspartic protease [Pseudomonadota bacterium]